MKDKVKQIEEIARDLKENLRLCAGVKLLDHNVETIAYELSKKYQPKISEDSVIISKKEYERLKRVENEKDRLYEIKLDLENQLIEKGWTDYEGADEIEKRVSKEMAEKWYNEVKKLYLENIGEQVFEHNWFGIQINRFAKQCGIKIKE